MLEVNYGAYVMNYLQFCCVNRQRMVSDQKLSAAVVCLCCWLHAAACAEVLLHHVLMVLLDSLVTD
jgi:hypothetical protein